MASAHYRGRMIVNDTDYTGSFVDPNPSGVATDDLNTIAIDGKIFNIAGSGGGGSGSGLPIFKEVTLYNAPDRTWRDITLADSLLNYDLVLFHVHDTTYNGSDANHQHEGALVFTKQELIDCYNDTKVLWLMGYDNTYALYTLTDYQTLTANTQETIFIQRITGVKFGSSQVSPIIYSTEEREVGVWTDNKPLYEKTVWYSNAIPYRTWTTLVDDSSITIVDHEGTVYLNGTPYSDMDYHRGIDNNEWVCSCMTDNGTKLQINQSFYAHTVTCRATYRFTKLADTAGSGSYTTLGVPAVHYTTEEQVIGTWTDGKTLYQKTLKSNSGIAQNSWVSIINDSSIRIKKYYGYIYYSANLEDGVKYPLDWTRVANSAFSCTECNGGSLEVVQNVGTSYGYDITIQYTKTSN